MGHRRDHGIDLASRQLITKAVGVESFISDKLMSVSPWMSRCLSGLVHLAPLWAECHG
jgi:hypothetical protein